MADDRITADLRAMSAAMDGDGVMPTDPSHEAVRFGRVAHQIRQAVRVEEAAVPPDLTAAVLARVGDASTSQGAAPDPVSRGRRPPVFDTPAGLGQPEGARSWLLVAGVVFLVAGMGAALLVAPGWRQGADVAAADVPSQVLSAQRSLDRLDAEVVIEEFGAHPDRPVRRYSGTLRYRAPEDVSLAVHETSPRPSGWPANDLDLVVAAGTVSRRGLRGCPPAFQPACLARPVQLRTTGLPPFAVEVQDPLDLIVPAGAFVADGRVPAAGVADALATVTDGMVTVEVTVAHVQGLVDVLVDGSALRRFHPSDPVALTLDATGLSLRRLVIRSGAGLARSGWAAGIGYTDIPGAVLLDVVVRPVDHPLPPPATAEGAPSRDAGFTDVAVPSVVVDQALPRGMVLHRTGVLEDGGAPTTVLAYTDGRAWVRVDVTTDWTATRLFGDLGPLVAPLPVGRGIGYRNPEGDVLAVRGDTAEYVLSGTVPLELLVQIAAGLVDRGVSDGVRVPHGTGAGEPRQGSAVVGEPLPGTWPQADLLDRLPTGALAPPGPLTARSEADGTILVAVPGTGSGGAMLTQRQTGRLPLPAKGDVVEVGVRGTRGRWSEPLGLLTWLEGAWVVELRSDGLDLDGLLAVADRLEAS